MSQSILTDFFGTVSVINMEHRPERLERLMNRFADSNVIDVNKVKVRKFKKEDNVDPPPWYRLSRSSYNIHLSHTKILQDTMKGSEKSSLIFEDDAFIHPRLKDKIAEFLDNVPDDWDQIYLGGKHLKTPWQFSVEGRVAIGRGIIATHAYATSRKGFNDVRKQQLKFQKTPDNPRLQMDVHMAHGQIENNLLVYCPWRWFFGQDTVWSDISHKVVHRRFWMCNPRPYFTEPKP